MGKIIYSVDTPWPPSGKIIYSVDTPWPPNGNSQLRLGFRCMNALNGAVNAMSEQTWDLFTLRIAPSRTWASHLRYELCSKVR